MSDACWSPATPQIIGAPFSAVAGAMGPLESTMVGIAAREMLSVASSASSQSRVSIENKPVTAAFDASVTFTAPSVSVQIIHESTVPTHRSRRRSGSALSSRCLIFVADWFGAKRSPSACRTRQSPSVRRSCQPSAGATGSPVLRSHTIVDARWVAMPMPSTGPPSARAARAVASAAAAMRVASNSTSPGAGVSGRTSCRCSTAIVASGRTIAERTPEVPMSTTRMLTVRVLLVRRQPSRRSFRVMRIPRRTGQCRVTTRLG